MSYSLNKKKEIMMILFFVMLFFLSLTESHALTGTVSGVGVNFRSGAGTNFSSMGKLNQGTVVTVKNAYAVSGAGCNSGWVNINYNNKDGYICKTYINISSANYNLPWTSPKKAILGGAEFVSSRYIAAGQFTSYLKKFNVNPNSSYAIYTHQYQTNLAGPFNEALTSYKSYKANGLLSLPLEFTIPIYNNMPTYTAHPVYGPEKGGTSVIKDQAFEKKLDEQGFDETYKKWLRELHNQYPNWTFKSMKTGLDFNTAVEKEKWIGAVNKNTCPKCIDSSNINTEGSWYIPSTQTTAYFLDPRNFLMADSILMYENLGYSENYQESAVQTVLNGTFMSGKDSVDGLAYSSLFMEAGKTYHVSPIYLAALSKQEVGVNGSVSTSGEKIEYKGNTYIGFYNFYNIGAYSSEESPVRAGIVYAATGASKNAQGVFMGNIPSSSSVSGNSNQNSNTTNQNQNNTSQTNPSVLPLNNHLSNMKLNRKENFLTNVSLGTTVGNLKKATNGTELVFRNQNGGILGDSEKMSTGSTITFPTGETLTIVVYGDLTGDGTINSADLLRMRQILLGQVKLDGAFLESARLINKTGTINSADLLRLRQQLLGQKTINQS